MAAPKPSRLPDPAPVRVARIGADGDGVAVLPDGAPVYLPDTLPGELVQTTALSRRGEGWVAASDVVEASPDRVVPPCPHFGPCGGCTLQHWRDEPYAAWKAGQVADALRRAGADVAVELPHRTPPGARRRIDAAILRGPDGIQVGLHRRRSRDVVDMRACPVLHPALFGVIQALRPVLPRLDALRREGSALLNLLDSGPDLLLRTDGPLSSGDRLRLAAFAAEQRLPRVSWARDAGPPETAALLCPATTALAGIDAAIPPGAFLQASREGEDAITAAVLAALPDAFTRKARIAELYAGVGTLTHALSTRARVVAYEGDPAACAALRSAGNQRVEVVQRDLARQPLQPKELAGIGCVVLDPPHAGAAAMVPSLAASGVARIIYVSCNPAALSRDARALIAGGYRVASAVAIDQFLWSAQVESVVLFQRG